MRLIAKTRLTHRPSGDEGSTGSTIVEAGDEFELNDRDAKILIAQGEAEEAKPAKKAEHHKDAPTK
jgi:hypothetical protein